MHFFCILHFFCFIIDLSIIKNSINSHSAFIPLIQSKKAKSNVNKKLLMKGKKIMTINNSIIKMQSFNTNRKDITAHSDKAKKGGKCICCKRKTTFYRCELSTNAVYICRECAESLQSYSFENFNFQNGTQTADNITIGHELEVMGDSLDAKIYFIKYGYIPTSDCTVTYELKSPIFNNLSALSKMCGMIEQLDKNENIDFSVNNTHCGLHTHYGYKNLEIQNTIYRNYTELFKPLNDYICSLSTIQRRKIFGSDFRGYAQEIDFYRPMRHENWINIQHSKTIEIRLFRFKSAEQYIKGVKVFRAMFDILFSNFDNLDISAERIGKKMLEKFIKEYADIINR